MVRHISVLAQEVLDGLHLIPGATVVDATVGLGGHAQLILDATSPSGILIGFDRDATNLAEAQTTLAAFGTRVRLIHDSFAHLDLYNLPAADGILFDLGFSSVHVDDASRGFSFQKDGPLDMRYDKTQEITAATIINGWSQEDLEKLFRVLGEEPRARDIAKAITHARRKARFETTIELAALIERVSPRRGKIHPATKVFQALRIQVNEEFEQIKEGLAHAVDLLKPGGRLCVITFHSLEDRLVKQFIQQHTQLERVTKKPVRPSWEEQRENPRSRSAKLRIAQKQGGYDIVRIKKEDTETA